MATVNVPSILDYSLALAAGGTATLGPPAAAKAWEVHSVIVSGLATIQREFDPDADATWETSVAIRKVQNTDGAELMGLKVELDENSRLAVVNDDSAAIDVIVLGIVIE